MDRILNTLELYYHTYLHVKPQYGNVQDLEQVIGELERHLSVSIGDILREEPLRQITEYMVNGFNNPGLSAVRSSFNAHLDLARLCYILCRIRKPQTVVETGVANGVTSTLLTQHHD